MKATKHEQGYIPENKTLNATERAERDYAHLPLEAGRYQAAQDLASERVALSREHRELVRIDRQNKVGEIAMGLRDYEEHKRAAQEERREAISLVVDSSESRELQVPVRQQ